MNEQYTENNSEKQSGENVWANVNFDDVNLDKNQEKQKFDRFMEQNIYNPDMKKMKENINDALERIDLDDMREIINSKKYGFRMGSRIMITHLSEQLDIERPDVVLKARDPDSNTLGKYNHRDKTLTVYYDSNDINDEWALIDLDTIAHEFWHAYQHRYIEKTGLTEDERTRLYKINFNNYTPDECDPTKYRKQLVEVEARLFASTFTERLVIGNKNRNTNTMSKLKRIFGSK